MHTVRSITLTVACSVAGLLSFSDQAKADPYYWGAGYGYSSYYAPYTGGYYTGYAPYWGGYNSYWSGYSPAWSSSYYWPSYTYASYAPAYAYGYGYGNACCAPSCCDPCGTGNCGPGGCGVAPPANAPKTPRPDAGPPPSTYEGDRSPNDGFKPRTDGEAPTPNGAPAPAADGDADAEKRDAFKQIETKKPVTEEPQIIPQKAPMKDPAESTPAPNTILGPKSTTPPATPPAATPAPTTPPAEATPAPTKEETKVEVEDLKVPAKPAEGDVHPPELKFDSKVTWHNRPSHPRLAMRQEVGSNRNVRTSPIPSNRNWVPVEKATVIVRK
ncbi:MAG: hypothetical protein AB7O26_18915 [Planctomycetaceae bacterium]